MASQDRDYQMAPAGSKEPAVFGGHHGRLYPQVGASLSECPTNLDLSAWEGKALALAAGNPGDLDFVDGMVKITATNYLILPEERLDPETGEISTFARTCLFDGQGRCFRTTSAHAPHRIAAALDLFGPEEWAKGIPFVVRERMSAKTKRVYHDIRLGVKP